MKVRKLTLMGLLCAIALTIFMVEAQIPAPVPLPGVKLGLSNIITVFAVFVLGPREGAIILFARIFLGAVFAGNFSTILYSGAGGLCAGGGILPILHGQRPPHLLRSFHAGGLSRHRGGAAALGVAADG